MADDIMPDIGRHFWVTAEMRARRVAAAAIYVEAATKKPYPLEALHELGLIRVHPRAERVLLRAILHADAQGEAGALDDYDARQSVAHEVIDIAASATAWEKAHGVADEDLLRVGQHVFVSSACADRLSKMDKSCRIWTAHMADVIDSWDVP